MSTVVISRAAAVSSEASSPTSQPEQGVNTQTETREKTRYVFSLTLNDLRRMAEICRCLGGGAMILVGVVLLPTIVGMGLIIFGAALMAFSAISSRYNPPL